MVANSNRNPHNDLHNACIEGDVEAVKSLLFFNKEIDSFCEHKKCKQHTPFILACCHGHVEIVKILLGRNIDVNHRDTDGKTGLYFACIKEHLEIVKLLLEDVRIDLSILYVDENTGFNFPLFNIMCKKGKASVVKILSEDERIDIDYENDHNITPFVKSFMSGKYEIAKILIDCRRFNPDKNYYVFSCTLNNDKLKILKYIVDKNIFDINHRNYHGHSAIDIAVLRADYGQIKVLLSSRQSVDLSKILRISPKRINKLLNSYKEDPKRTSELLRADQ